jgi:hypothetical protein
VTVVGVSVVVVTATRRFATSAWVGSSIGGAVDATTEGAVADADADAEASAEDSVGARATLDGGAPPHATGTATIATTVAARRRESDQCSSDTRGASQTPRSAASARHGARRSHDASDFTALLDDPPPPA